MALLWPPAYVVHLCYFFDDPKPSKNTCLVLIDGLGEREGAMIVNMVNVLRAY